MLCPLIEGDPLAREVGRAAAQDVITIGHNKAPLLLDVLAMAWPALRLVGPTPPAAGLPAGRR